MRLGLLDTSLGNMYSNIPALFQEVCTRLCVLAQLHGVLISFCLVSIAAPDLLRSGYEFPLQDSCAV